MYLYDRQLRGMQSGLHEAAPSPLTPPPYVPPFPNIKQHCPWEYDGAVKAQNEFKKMEWFAPLYKDIYDAAVNASLSLGRGDTLVIKPEKESFLKLLGKEVVQDLSKHIVEKILSNIFDESVMRALGLFDLVLKIAAIYQGIQNVKLVNEQQRSMRDEAMRKKVSFFVDAKAQLLLRKRPGADPFKLRNWLFTSYWRYDSVSKSYLEYQLKEQSRCGRERIQPTIRARP